MGGRRDRDQVGDRVDAGRPAATPRWSGTGRASTPRRGAGRPARRGRRRSASMHPVDAPWPRRRAGPGRPARAGPTMNRLPSASTRYAPSPRSASLTSGCCAARRRRRARATVGWNWTNSRSVTAAPARSASATPSPVDTDRVGGGGEDLAHAAGGQHHRAGQHRADAVLAALAQHVQGDPAGPAVGGRAAGRAPARARPAGSTGRGAPPRAAPAAPRRRSRRRRRARSGRAWWPPSRVSISEPSGSRSNSAPQRDQLAHRGPGPRSTSTPHRRRVAQPDAGDQRCRAACAAGVSAGRARRRCRPAPSGSSRRRAALVTTVTAAPASRRCSAAVSPAMPEPTTTTSASAVQPGSGRPAGAARDVTGRVIARRSRRSERQRHVVDQPGACRPGRRPAGRAAPVRRAPGRGRGSRSAR